MKKMLRVWRLRSHLSALLVVTMLLTFTLVGGALMAYRIPDLERERQRALQVEVGEVGERLELLLSGGQNRLEMLESLLATAPEEQANTVLDNGLRSVLSLRAAYLVSAQGEVLAVGLPEAQRGRRYDVLGSDLSANALFRAVSDMPAGPAVVWSGRYLSLLTGQRLVGVALRDRHGRVLMAEAPSQALLDTVNVATGGRSSALWIVERSGEIIVDTGDGQRETGKLNIRNWPLMQAQLQGQEVGETFRHQGADFHAAVSHSSALDWFFVGYAPTGLADPQVRDLVLSVVVSLGACLLTGLVIAPLWASRLVRPLQQIVARAEQTTQGHAQGAAWPRGPVEEFNRLSGDLEKMAAALQEREQKFLAIFNASPVPVAVVDTDNGHRLLDVNEAWCRDLKRRREDVLGRTAQEIGLLTAAQREGLLAQGKDGRLDGEAILMRGDGQPMQGQLFGRPVALPTQNLIIWATVDVGPMRRIEHELRELNQQLEARVEQRTQALADANAELSDAVGQLRTAQGELVRAEKMAALGGLVAGVAHELNTPLGNGVMAVSAMADATRQFKAAMQGGLRRADLQQLVDSMEQGTDIAARNLRRAADLVHSFKQVAVDQTSAQRRSFELGEVVHEMVVSLRPSFSRTPYRIEVDVPETGLRLDSYPGALGQAIGNLIQNAVLHGFDGRVYGTVRIDAQRAEDGAIVLRVADDGRGIAPQNLGRIFEPFMTTKMGSGGTGLGLHISYNAVANLLGGTLTVQSTEGEGTCFEMRLPVRAPDHPPAGEGS